MYFLVDEQLPAVLARWISTQNCRADHVSDVGLAVHKGIEIWDFAGRADTIIISMDDDFAKLKKLDSNGPCLVWVRWGITRRGALLTKIEAVWPTLITRLESGDRLVELTS